MSFKKKKIGQRDNKVLNIVGIISIGIIFIVALVLIKNINFFKIQIDQQGVLDNYTAQGTEEKKGLFSSLFGKKDETDTKEEITFLLVGRGGARNDAPDLTDTIILLKANTEKKAISMLSIPRDLYVKYSTIDYYEGKINGIYSRYFSQKRDSNYGMEMLGKKISDITGIPIDYYVNIDFNGFIEIIDTIQGIVIEVPERLVDYEYPDDNWGYRTLIFEKGIWLFDGESALKYVRSRHSTSDFDRSLRQQQVINAIKDKLLSTYLITSPSKIKELYGIFDKNLMTNITLTKVLSLAYSFRNVGEYSIVSANMNDSCFYGSSICSKGGILYTPQRDLFDGLSVLLLNGTGKGAISNYELMQKYANVVINYPGVELEKLNINIFNSVKVNNLAGQMTNNILRYGFNISKIGNIDTEYEKTAIYYNNVPENSDTIKALKLFFKGEFIPTEMPKYSEDNANIEIVVGRDYLGSEKIFNF